MKYLATFAAVLFVASQVAAQTQPVAPTADTDTKSTAAKPADKATDAKPADPKAAPETKTPAKKVEEPKILGQTIARDNGSFLGLEVVGGNFKLSFYDKKKKAMAPDITRGAARWPNVRGPGDNRTVLNLSGNSLIGSKPVLPPFTYNVYLTLLQGDGDNQKAVENYVVPFRG